VNGGKGLVGKGVGDLGPVLRLGKPIRNMGNVKDKGTEVRSLAKMRTRVGRNENREGLGSNGEVVEESTEGKGKRHSDKRIRSTGSKKGGGTEDKGIPQNSKPRTAQEKGGIDGAPGPRELGRREKKT